MRGDSSWGYTREDVLWVFRIFLCKLFAVNCFELEDPGTVFDLIKVPVHHHFNWEQGRVLAAYQLVYVTEGQGTFVEGN